MRKTVLASAILVAGYVVFTASCGSSFTSAPDGGGGSAGSGGKAGSAGQGGTSGTGGTTGSEGTAGSGGARGASGSGGSTGSGSGGATGGGGGGSAGTGSGGSSGTGTGGGAGSGGAGGSGGTFMDASLGDSSFCGKKTRTMTMSDASMACTTGETYTCAGTTYTIACMCPASASIKGSCTCSSVSGMGGSGSTPFTYAGCPDCTMTDFGVLAVVCGFPF